MQTLKLVPRACNPQVVDLLERYLQMAKEGEIESCAIVAVLADRSSIDASTDTHNFQSLIGGISILQHKMMNSIVELPNDLDS